ncbi:Na(+)/H(+) antiporter subunit A MhnA [Psychroflexus gondwanensis ACAM 44]|jgi:multicomponent Na+:H+ antiporter subunit A|uniref:Na(+)/H(+) antiporter subunit A MhnA n=1 Tax=Psychroflexus gondwanensis ACAM 44 TaxID=1189619 RepID=N1WZ68_9FLAO|nr:putative monovalent cation/H+ antiporter subunit A [Psychroflexus gondwanensis]EMY81183.1 Na(+)/H(+) antiporter subunit A MhnA [Psychroflexus gondwanensis ACAM 44]
MLEAVLLGFLFSLFLVFAGSYFRGRLAVLSSLIPLSLFIYFSTFISEIADGKVIYENHEWIPSFGVNLSFTLDGLALLFALMITGVGTLVFVYTSAYLKDHKYLDRFYGYLSLFMAAMLGLVLSDNLMTMFIFWELTSISSFYLIGFNNDKEDSRKSALIALGVTGIGGLMLLGGAVLLGDVAGTYRISEMLSSREAIADSSHYVLILFFIFSAAFTKSAQFPFHFWLPGAMKAPTPVSTYLHSATMVKAGVYLLFRMSPVLNGAEIWHTVLIVVGGVTMIYSAIHIIFRTDLKGILAYSTISALGILVFLIGIGTQAALIAAAVFIVVHALYKASLFLITGIIDHETGTRDVTQLAGLRKVLLPVAIAGFIAALISGGVPPTLGFVGKDLIYESTLHFKDNAILLTIIALSTNVLLFYAGFVAGVKPFIGKLPKKFEKVHLPSPLMWVPPLIMTCAGLVFGLFPGLIETAIAKPIAMTQALQFEDFHLKLWHGFNTILALSATTLILGTVLYFVLKPKHSLENTIAKLDVIAPKTLLLNLSEGFAVFSKYWTNIFQTGYLRHYLFIIVSFLILLLGYLIFSDFSLKIDTSSLADLTIYEISILIMLLLGVLYTVFTKSRLAAVASLGVVGLSFSLLFLFYSAPDLAMTQFSVDTLTVILFVLVLYRLPKYLNLSDSRLRIKHGILSVSFGVLITLLILKVLGETKNTEVTEFYAENAYKLAKGKNIVNVILVDFRGIDTMIEISVLIVAALGVFGLLKLRLKTKDKK